MFARNKALAWVALVAALACVFNARPEKRTSSLTNIAIGATAVVLVYLPVLLPQPGSPTTTTTAAT